MNRYARILEAIFLSKFREGATHLDFARTDIHTFADQLGVKRPSNLGDVLYSYRYRQLTSAAIAARTTDGHEWIIRGIGTGLYRLRFSRDPLAGTETQPRRHEGSRWHTWRGCDACDG